MKLTKAQALPDAFAVYPPYSPDRHGPGAEERTWSESRSNFHEN
jgi:hypothetical protein